jgi:hypothetical protein
MELPKDKEEAKSKALVESQALKANKQVPSTFSDSTLGVLAKSMHYFYQL